MENKYLIDARKKTGRTQRSVALEAEITPAHYNRIENGKRQPSVDVAKKIAEVLGFDWTEFFREV